MVQYTRDELAQGEELRERDLERRYRGTAIQCPRCGELADIERYYLGGYGTHWHAVCRADPDHQAPLVFEDGCWRIAVYTRNGGEYRIVAKWRHDLRAARGRYLGASDLVAWANGGEPWQYPEAENPDPAPDFVAAEAEQRQAAERSYIAIPTRARMPEIMQEVL